MRTLAEFGRTQTCWTENRYANLLSRSLCSAHNVIVVQKKGRKTCISFLRLFVCLFFFLLFFTARVCMCVCVCVCEYMCVPTRRAKNYKKYAYTCNSLYVYCCSLVPFFEMTVFIEYSSRRCPITVFFNSNVFH